MEDMATQSKGLVMGTSLGIPLFSGTGIEGPQCLSAGLTRLQFSGVTCEHCEGVHRIGDAARAVLGSLPCCYFNRGTAGQ